MPPERLTRDRRIADLYWTESGLLSLTETDLRTRLAMVSDAHLRAWTAAVQQTYPTHYQSGLRLADGLWPVYCCGCGRLLHVHGLVCGTDGLCDDCAFSLYSIRLPEPSRDGNGADHRS